MKLKHKILITMAAVGLMGCANTDTGNGAMGSVTTLEQQQAVSPAEVLSELTEGNERFVRGNMVNYDYESQVELSQESQYPKSVILSCLDSRIPVETIFDLGIGDAFVARVAGNIANEDILGSMEFATEVSGAKLVAVIGHTSCGAIKGADAEVELGNLTPLLEKIQPAVENVRGSGDHHQCSHDEIVDKIAAENVVLTIDNIRENSPVIRGLEEQGKIKIVGGMYDMTTGRVEWLDI